MILFIYVMGAMMGHAFSNCTIAVRMHQTYDTYIRCLTEWIVKNRVHLNQKIGRCKHVNVSSQFLQNR